MTSLDGGGLRRQHARASGPYRRRRRCRASLRADGSDPGPDARLSERRAACASVASPWASAACSGTTKPAPSSISPRSTCRARKSLNTNGPVTSPRRTMSIPPWPDRNLPGARSSFRSARSRLCPCDPASRKRSSACRARGYRDDRTRTSRVALLLGFEAGQGWAIQAVKRGTLQDQDLKTSMTAPVDRLPGGAKGSPVSWSDPRLPFLRRAGKEDPVAVHLDDQNANHLRESADGWKVGGHQASSASLATIMTALYMAALRPEDRVAVKPHASPVYHAIRSICSGKQSRGNLENFRAASRGRNPIPRVPRMP